MAASSSRSPPNDLWKSARKTILGLHSPSPTPQPASSAPSAALLPTPPSSPAHGPPPPPPAPPLTDPSRPARTPSSAASFYIGATAAAIRADVTVDIPGLTEPGGGGGGGDNPPELASCSILFDLLNDTIYGDFFLTLLWGATSVGQILFTWLIGAGIRFFGHGGKPKDVVLTSTVNFWSSCCQLYIVLFAQRHVPWKQWQKKLRLACAVTVVLIKFGILIQAIYMCNQRNYCEGTMQLNGTDSGCLNFVVDVSVWLRVRSTARRTRSMRRA